MKSCYQWMGPLVCLALAVSCKDKPQPKKAATAAPLTSAPKTKAPKPIIKPQNYPQDLERNLSIDVSGQKKTLGHGQAYLEEGQLRVRLTEQPASCEDKDSELTGFALRFQLPQGPKLDHFKSAWVGTMLPILGPTGKTQTTIPQHRGEVRVDEFDKKAGALIKGSLRFRDQKKKRTDQGSGKFSATLCPLVDSKTEKTHEDQPFVPREGAAQGTFGEEPITIKSALAIVWKDATNDLVYLQTLELYRDAKVNCGNKSEHKSWVLRLNIGLPAEKPSRKGAQPVRAELSRVEQAEGRYMAQVDPLVGNHWVKMEQPRFRKGQTLNALVVLHSDGKTPAKLSGKIQAKVCPIGSF